MGRIWAVAKNTFVSSMRMRIAIVFMFLLVVLLPVLSLTSTGDGTAIGRVQSFISYGLGLVAFLLSVLTIIVSCYTLSSDIKHKQIYTVITKPIRRFELIIGKVLGVVLLDLLLLVVFSSIIYSLTLQMPRFVKTDEDEKARLDNEFFTARAALKIHIDEQKVENRVQEAYNELVKTGQLGEGRTKEGVLKELRDAEKFSRHSAEPGGTVFWEFENVKPMQVDANIFVRFKFNASQEPPDKNIYGVWYVGDYRQIESGQQKMKTPIYGIPRKDTIESRHEFEVPADAVASDGYLAVVFYNEPMNETTTIFPVEDGLEVLYKAGSFSDNFLRATVVIFARLVFLAALGVSLSTWLGFPVAILCCFTVFSMGVINGFVVQSFDYLGKNVKLFYTFVVKPLIWLLPKFDESFNINKYLIEAKQINIVFMAEAIGVLLLKSLILLLAGFLIFAKREIAKVIV
ncbi:MAG: hypothetical protein ABSE89_00425 [Sedimentisphaerales bacterium]